MKRESIISKHKNALLAGAILSAITAPFVRDFIVGFLRYLFG